MSNVDTRLYLHATDRRIQTGLQIVLLTHPQIGDGGWRGVGGGGGGGGRKGGGGREREREMCLSVCVVVRARGNKFP